MDHNITMDGSDKSKECLPDTAAVEIHMNGVSAGVSMPSAIKQHATLEEVEKKAKEARLIKKRNDAEVVARERVRVAEEERQLIESQQAEALAKEMRAERKKIRREALPSIVNEIIAGDLSICSAIKKHPELQLDRDMLKRNVESVQRGDGLRRSGPKPAFTPSEVQLFRAQQVENAISITAVKDDKKAASINGFKSFIAEKRAVENGSTVEEVKGKDAAPLQPTSIYKYTKLLFDKKVKGYDQNEARRKAVNDLYNAISFVVALRAMYGYHFGEDRSGKFFCDGKLLLYPIKTNPSSHIGLTEFDLQSLPRAPHVLINMDGSCSYLGVSKEGHYVWTTLDGEKAANAKNLSIASSHGSDGPPLQKRSIRYLPVVNAVGDCLAMVSYVKDNHFPEDRCDLVDQGVLGSTHFFTMLEAWLHKPWTCRDLSWWSTRTSIQRIGSTCSACRTTWCRPIN